MNMKIGTARLVWKNTTEESMSYFSGMNVQLVFRPRGFYEMKHDEIVGWIRKYEINPLSIHYPSFRGDDPRFLDNIKMLRDTYSQKLFTVHPRFESLDDAVIQFRRVEEGLDRLGVDISYENMPGPKGAWNVIPSNLLGIGGSITFDITHLPRWVDDKEEFSEVASKVNVVHLSNVRYDERGTICDHQRIEEGDRDLFGFVRYLKEIDYSGQVILEYLPRTTRFAKEDIAKLERL